MRTMPTRPTTLSSRVQPPLRGRWLWVSASAGLTALALLAAGCGGSSPNAGAAHATSSPLTSAHEPSSQPGQLRVRGLLALAACMRKNGVPNFPDPTSKGTLLLSPSSGIDPQSPSFQAAARACAKLAPGGPPGGASPAQAQAKALKFARCMRSHGEPNFPDPKFLGGGFTVQLPTGVDPSSPQWQHAMQACQSLSVLPGGGG